MNKAWSGSILALVIAAGPAAAGDAAFGAQKAAVCGACHGMTGSSVNPEWPSLAGQPEAYIVAQLQQFKQGARVNPLMTPMAAPLAENDMQDLGAHFAQQTPAGLEADPSIQPAQGIRDRRAEIRRQRHHAARCLATDR
jgi:cytochrome c553